MPGRVGGGSVTRGWKITVVVLAAVAILSTPLFWLLGSPDAGQLVGASIQVAAGVAALVWALLQRPASRMDDAAVRTGAVQASGSARAVTGIGRRQGHGGGTASVQDTGHATAAGEGSSAVSGIDYT